MPNLGDRFPAFREPKPLAETIRLVGPEPLARLDIIPIRAITAAFSATSPSERSVRAENFASEGHSIAEPRGAWRTQVPSAGLDTTAYFAIHRIHQ